ncbi:MAG: hypothetical protein AAB726_02330 [Patescibacteria group bacterium]
MVATTTVAVLVGVVEAETGGNNYLSSLLRKNLGAQPAPPFYLRYENNFIHTTSDGRVRFLAPSCGIQGVALEIHYQSIILLIYLPPFSLDKKSKQSE